MYITGSTKVCLNKVVWPSLPLRLFSLCELICACLLFTNVIVMYFTPFQQFKMSFVVKL